MFHAHSLVERPESEWQGLADHLHAVGTLAAARSAKFGALSAGRYAGLLHDLGKYSLAFQRRIRTGDIKVDHATAGAKMAVTLVETTKSPSDLLIARILAHAIAGHHAGLPDSIGSVGALDDRFSRDLEPLVDLWRDEIVPTAESLWPTLDFTDLKDDKIGLVRARALAFFGRMMFSALVDADFRDTEAFYAAAEGTPVDRDWPKLMDVVDDLIARLDTHMTGLAARAADTPVNRLRGEILTHVRAGAEKSTGLFTLTVPTGGGKTLASLAFALDHAKRHGLDRIVYAIPFTSVIDQTAKIFRDVLGDDVVLEHHSSIDEERLGDRSARDKLRLAMEDWAAPIVVTTNVQLFESLHSHRPSRARRLHNLTRAVIVLDEAQTIPRPVLRPCVAAIGELARRYGTSVVLCTATQPALGREEGFPDGLTLDRSRELAPDPDRLTAALARVRLARVGELDDEALVSALEASPQGLVIVNSRRHALALYQTARAAGLDGVIHLSTRQYAADRVRILDGVRRRLKNGAPCRVVATSLVEAGVDVDFPRVWRAEAGLDQIAQAAGRCNREGKRPIDESVVTVFRAPDHPPPREIAGLVADMERVSAHHDDLLTNAAIRDYFGEVFWRVGPERLDRFEVMKAYRLSAGVPSFDYRKVGEAFRLIDSAMAPVIVAIEDEARKAVDDLERGFLPPGAAARKLQRFLVQIPPKTRFALIARRDVRLIREKELGDQFAVLVTEKLYRPDVGLHWEAADADDLDLMMA